jgi:two-component system cell cycle sensor histidine kinase/response regulator CckA
MPNERIQVVEDEAIVAMDISSGLRRLGYEIVGVASTGQSAIDLATETMPDLVLMDIRLHGEMDGIQAANIIHQRFEIPIVFLTAHADVSTVQRSMTTAPYGYVLKPFDDADLHRAIELALARFRHERDERAEELWSSEERFRLLVDAIEDYAIIILDLNARIQSWNRGAERLYGWTAEEAVGKSLATFLSGDENDPDAIHRALAETLQKGRTRGEGWRVRKDGSKFWAQVVRTPFRDRGGVIRGFASISHDLTERRKLESQLLHAQKLESLGRLSGGIAHDFNNMLMVIFSRVEVLSRAVGDTQPQRRYIEDIRAAAARNRDLTQQLLIAARREVLQPRSIQMNDIVTAELDLLQPSIGENVVLRTDLQEQLWPVYADPAKLHQVLLNLVLNARDAMPNGGTISVETRNVRADASYVKQRPHIKEGDYVSLVVSDTGSGIQPEVREQIFDAFFTTKTTGSGLGLAVVRGIVDATGGYIWFYSEVGEGTSFKILVPRYRGQAEAVRDTETIEAVTQGTETILLVEDEQLLRTIIRETLEENGYTVIDARTPAEAISLSRKFEKPIDVLLTDMILPGMNGVALAEVLTKERSEMRVIYMSGYTDNAIVHRGVLDPGVHFIEKPAPTNVLLRTIRAVLAK